MSVKVYKRNTAGRRGMSIAKPDNLTDKKPERSLLGKINRKYGRSKGKISMRHRGAGAKRRYRQIDFRMDKYDIPGKIVAIEKDPFRSALIALVVFEDGDKRYVLASSGMKKGKSILISEKAPIKEGNRLQLKNVPVGSAVCNVELSRGAGAKLMRSAGSSAMLQAVDEGMAHLKLASGEVRMVKEDCFATLGQVSNSEHNNIRVGKAGRKRHMGRRPRVRGTAMNPIDHPHGGGEGSQPIGLKHPKTPWGKPALGVKTRKKKRYSDKFIIQRRKKRKK